MVNIAKHYGNLILKTLNNKVAAIIILCCLGILIYSNTFLNSFQFDDIYSIITNSAIRDIRSLQNIWNFWPTRFITYLSIAFNYHCGWLSVFDYHVFNLLTHLGSGIMAWWLVTLTLNTPALRKESISAYAGPLAFFTGAIFLSHPIQTQPVDYIIQRSTLLASFFYIASLCFYAKARLTQEEKNGGRSCKVYYGVSFLAAITGMFCKEIAISLPIAVCIYEFYFLRSKTRISRKYVIPFLILILVIPLTMFFTRSVDFHGMRFVKDGVPGISSWHYFLTQTRVLVTYLRLLFVPVNQNLDYYYPVSKSLFEMPVLLSLLLLALVISAGVKLFHEYRLLSFCVFWFFITLLLESSVIPIADVIFEHRLYLPMVGFSLFLAGGLFYLSAGRHVGRVFIILILLVACYSVMTYQRNKVWQSEVMLWDDTVRKSPLKARPYYNRALAYENKGDLYSTIADYSKAAEINPQYYMAYNNRGIVYAAMGSFDQAIADFLKTIQINPRYAEAYNNRAVVYFKMREYSKAWDDVHRAEALGYKVNPKFIEELRSVLNK